MKGIPMKRFSSLLISFFLVAMAVPLAAKTVPSPYKVIVVKRFLSAGENGLSNGFLDAFMNGLRASLQKEKSAEAVQFSASSLAPADLANSLTVEGQFIAAEYGNMLTKSGSVNVKVNIFRLSDGALLGTIQAKATFKGVLDNDEKSLGEIAAEQVAYAIGRELKSLTPGAVPPAMVPTPVSAATVPAAPPAEPAVKPSAAVGAPTQPAPALPQAPTHAPAPASPLPAPAPAPAQTLSKAVVTQPDAPFATVQFSSDPVGAEIAIDGDYAGNAPSLIKVAPGRHVFEFTKPGYLPWRRSMEIRPDERRNIAAELEKK